MRIVETHHNDASNDQLLRSNSQIIFDAHLKANQFGLTITAILTTLVWIMFETPIGIENSPTSVGSIFLVPIQIIAAMIMFMRPTIFNLGVSYALFMSCQIAITLWHITQGTDGFVHGTILYSIGYIAFSIVNISIIPRHIYTLLPIFIGSLLYLFFQHTDQYDDDFNSLVLVGFIINICAMSFIAFITKISNSRITNLLEKQRVQIDRLFNENNLLNFALGESNQTLVVQNDNGISQFPLKNEFSEIIDHIDHASSLSSTLFSSLGKSGYLFENTSQVLDNRGRSQFIFTSTNGRSYIANASITPSNIESVLLTDVTRFMVSNNLLTAGLNGNKIGIGYYDSKGQMFTFHGKRPFEISSEILSSLVQIKALIGSTDRKDAIATQITLDTSHYDITIMSYGENTLVTFQQVENLRYSNIRQQA